VVVLAEPAAEATVREDAAPAFADQGGVHQARGVLQWETQEELFDEIVGQICRQRRHVARQVGGGED
jgi:hypothetical protein